MFVQRLNIQNSSVRFVGDGLYQAQVNLPSSFLIHAYPIIDQWEKIQIITHPAEYPCQIDINDNHDGTYIVNYTPKEIGQIGIDIFLDDKRLNTSPYRINVFDVNQVYVSDIHDGFVDQLVRFHLDTTRAGIGQLEIIVEEGQVACDVISRASSQYDVTFLPHRGGLYKIDIRFNGLIIPGSPFTCSIRDLSRVIVSNTISTAHVGEILSFDIDNQNGSIDVQILAPSGHAVRFHRSQLTANQLRIDYLLDEIGLHRVDVRSDETMNIYGSSFTVQAFDTNRLIISDIPRFVIFNQPVEFTIDASKAGEGQLEVDINNGLVPNQVRSLGNSKFLFTFLPLLNETHRLSIKFNGRQVSGFPKECQVITSENIRIHGLGLNQVLLNTQTWFLIDTSQGGLADLRVRIVTPSNDQFNPSTLLTSAGLKVDWTPTEIGTYIIYVMICDKPIPGSPFHVKCYDPQRVIVIPSTNDSSIHKPTKFLIDASKAGEGNLEISVSSSGQNIPNHIIPIGNSRFEVQFTPQKSTIHHCKILFNGEPVPGSPFAVNVMEIQRIMAIGKGLGAIPVHIPTSFMILTHHSLGNDLRCTIKGPNDQLISCIITKIDLNRFEVTYTPDRVGEYRIEIYYDNIPIDNSPFVSRSFDVNKIKIQDFPSSTLVGSSTYFLVDATDSGFGNLEIAISRDGKNIPNYVQNEGGARFRIKFIPDQALIHHVQLKFNAIEIPGSPFACDVYASEFTFENYEYAPIHKKTSFAIRPRVSAAMKADIHVDIIAPSGRQIKGKISTKTSTIDFLPNEIGDHEIRFYSDVEKKILLTKFICQVYDSSKIHVSDLPFAVVHRPCKLTIDTTEAGNGVLAVKIKQNDKKIPHEQMRISTHIYEISFTPEATDDCTIQISFNRDHSAHKLIIPVKADCEQVRVSSIPSGIVGQPIVFTVDAPELNLISIAINESHSGRAVSHTITQKSTDKNQYQISFTPNLARQHTICISYDGKLISTHHVDVCNLNKIRVSSITDGIVGNPSVFSVDTHGAGEGHLEVTISDGQRTLPAELKSTQARKFDIAFVPETSGKHSIRIAFNSIPIEGSPFIISVREPSVHDLEDDDDHEFIIGGQLQGTKVGEVAWLICETSITDIYEDCDLYVTDPEEIVIKHTRIQDSAGRWRVEFEPITEGVYKIQTDVEQSPITLASMEILPVDYERTIYGERIVHPNVMNFLSIDCPDENLNVQLKSSNGTEIPMEIERDSSEWKIYFTLTEIDVYQLAITDQPVFEVHCVSEETDLFRNGGIEDIARLIIEQGRISTDDVNVIVKDPFAHTIPAAFYRNSTNDLIIEYIPIRPDIHEVFIRTQNNLLDICPIRVLAFQSKNTFEPVLRVQVKEVLEHTFPGVIDPDSKLDITIMDPFEQLIPFQRLKNENLELTISLSPVRVGTHWMRISNDENDSFALIPIFAFDDDYIALSPVGTPSSEEKTIQNQIHSLVESFPVLRDLTTISETSEISTPRTASVSSNVHLSTSNRDTATDTDPTVLSRSMDLNGRSSPEVHILDITDLEDSIVKRMSTFSFKDPYDKFDVRLYDANEDEIAHTIERLDDGRKVISYEPMIIGPMEIHMTRDSHEINGSPLIVNAFDPSAVQLIDFPQRIFINTTTSFLLDPTQAGKGSLRMTIKDPNNQSLPIDIQKESNNQFSIQFTPTVLGIHILTILFNRISIPKIPFQFFVENLEESSRSIYSKHESTSLAPQQENVNFVSPQPTRSNDTPPPPPQQKDSSNTKPEEKPLEYPPFNDYDIQRFQASKERFEHKQPIDIVFDPRRYPFQIFFQNSAPFIDNDVHFLIDLPYIVYVNVTINDLIIPLQLVRKTEQAVLLKFTPVFAGDYSIVFKDYNAQPMPGCPYIFPVYNPNGIHIESSEHFQPITDCHFICNIDNIGQGKFFLMVYYQSKPIRISYKIQSLNSTRIRVSLLPLKIGTYRVYLAYRNFPIRGSPIDITVYDLQGISITAEHQEPVVVKTTVAYKVNINQAGQGQVKAELIPPETSMIPCRCHVHELNHAEYLIEYIPNEPGRYQLRILFNNQLIQGKTMDTDVYSLLPIPFPTSSGVHLQKIQPDDTPKVGDKVILQIITEKSNIHAQVSCNGLSIPCRIQSTEDKQLWHLNFRPYTVGTYKILLFHNNLSLMHSPYLIQVQDIDGKNYLSGFTNTPCTIQVRTKSASSAQIRAVVLLGGIQIPSTMSILHEHVVGIHFIPQEPGFYFVNIYNGNQSIEGSPFLIRIKRPQVVQISGKCLDRLRVNDLGIFRIHCHGQRGIIKAKIFHLPANDRCDIGQLISFQLLETYEQLIEFPSQIFLRSLTILLTARLRLTQDRIRNVTVEEDSGHAIVSFQLFEIPNQLPTNEQIINVLRNLIDKQTLNLFAPNGSLLHAIAGSLVIGPKGEPVVVKLFSLSNGDYLAEFTPKNIGQHRIDVTFEGKPIESSPFFTEIYDRTEVKIPALPKGIIVGIENAFDIHTDNAGNAPLEVVITSPSGTTVPCKIDDLSTIKRVRFTPIEIGPHTLNVKFGLDTIPGTPMKLMVTGTRSITAYGDGLQHSLQDKGASFMIDTKEMEGDLKVRIEGPNSVIQNNLERINDSVFKVTYTPLEVGLMKISIKWNGKEIMNSPFTVMVTNPERVQMVDDKQSILNAHNYMHGKIDEEKKIHFDTSYAGPGTLKATMQSMDNNSIPVRIDQQGTLYTIGFILPREGQYDLNVTYADQPLPNMPIRFTTDLMTTDHSKIEIYGDGLYEARVHEEARFTIDASKAMIAETSKPIIRLTTEQAGYAIQVRVTEKQRHVFHCSYAPTLPGTYILSIQWLGKELHRSPFNVNILSDNQKRHSASQVICSGDALHMGIIGQEMSCFIDTRHIHPGELTAYCQGTHKIAHCRLIDHRDGKFTLFIKPEESGKHLLTIKYNGENVPGSPYTVKVSGLPDARKVRISGPGIQHGVLSTYQSSFICETKGAGAGQLTVKIRGPKGAFRVEMQRKNIQDRTILCQYYPSEAGDYLISVKWSGQHVLGSPFHTHIFETQAEFDEFQRELQTSRLVGQQRTERFS